MFKLYLFLTFIFISINIFAGSKIYLIRHAAVQIESHGWYNAQGAHIYKEEYNNTNVHIFDPEIVLNKINHPEKIDAVFCSPQLRAVQTANLLFKEHINLKIIETLMELDYPVIRIPLIKMPVKIWLTISRISWMTGINQNNKPTYRQRKNDLKILSNELISYAEKHGKSVVIAHGMVNRELIRILKKKGWKFEQKDGLGNLSVNCLVK